MTWSQCWIHQQLKTWFETITSKLLSLSYERSLPDPCRSEWSDWVWNPRLPINCCISSDLLTCMIIPYSCWTQASAFKRVGFCSITHHVFGSLILGFSEAGFNNSLEGIPVTGCTRKQNQAPVFVCNSVFQAVVRAIDLDFAQQMCMKTRLTNKNCPYEDCFDGMVAPDTVVPYDSILWEVLWT